MHANSNDFDLVILGAGPAGERAAVQAARNGKRVALVEQERVVGGTAINWGAIPSKTLRESALWVQSLTTRKLEGIPCHLEGEVTVQDFMYRKQQVVQRELELINKALGKYAVTIFHGHGAFLDPHTVEVLPPKGGEPICLTAPIAIIATGTRPNRPQDVVFDGEVVFDSDSILDIPRMPHHLIVLGAGVIGVEYASIFAALGVRVTLVDTRERMLPYLDAEVVAILQTEMRKLGVDLVQEDHYQTVVRKHKATPSVEILTRRGRKMSADALLYCVGRDGNTHDLGLDRIGLVPDDRGLLSVNENFQTVLPHVYAVGDVIGYPALASTSMEQGRQAARHAFGIPGPRARTEELPFAIYSVPELSYVGQTEEALREQGREVRVGCAVYQKNPRGQIIGDTGGLLKLVFDAKSQVLLGVHVVGTNASELVHIGVAFLKHQATAEQIAETLFNYPSLSDLYRHAAFDALAAKSNSP